MSGLLAQQQMTVVIAGHLPAFADVVGGDGFGDQAGAFDDFPDAYLLSGQGWDGTV